MDTLTTRMSAGLRVVLQEQMEAKARLQGKAFFCNALAGNSKINVCINSDLSVSCNCHDVDGSGHIGDLKRESLAEVFSGEAAGRFREQLAQGRLPTPMCARCCDLRIVPKDKARRLAHRHHLPGFLMVENTSACNLRCMSCPREKIRRIRSKACMSLEDVTKVATQLREAGIKQVAYLNLGEPFLSKNIRRELEIIREINPGIWINTSTNATLIDTDDKRDAALLIDKMEVSLDGCSQETAGRYQRGLDFETAYRNMQALVEYRDAKGSSRPQIVWKYLLFRWNDRKKYLSRAVEMARQAKVDAILFEKTVSPLHGISLRSYLGLHDDIGEGVEGGRLVALR
jgi:hypothetical protein